MASPHQSLLDALGRFRASWPRRGWSFDNRVQCVASTFDSDYAQEARVLIQKLLPSSWNDRTISTASPLIAQVAQRTGGARSSQMIFGGDRVGYVTPYGLWWPWEEGKTISLRLGLEGATQSDILDLCNVFGAEP
jgi:hypothetical protein